MTKGERIKELRIAMDYTLDELAELCGTTKQTIHKYETGIITNIPTDKVEALAEALHVSPNYIMGWEEPPVEIDFDDNQILWILRALKYYKATCKTDETKDAITELEHKFAKELGLED